MSFVPWDLKVQAKLREQYPLGTKVRVLTRYQGAGHYAPDGWEGEWYVVGHLMTDLEIARHPDDDYAGIVHLQRIAGDPRAHWHRDEQKQVGI